MERAPSLMLLDLRATASRLPIAHAALLFIFIFIFLINRKDGQMKHARSPGCRLVHALSFWNLQARRSLYSIIDLSASSR